jgi:hypothetical protein
MKILQGEEPDLRLAEELVFAQRGLDVQRFSRAETVAGRTPDFRVTQAGELVAFCEVKSPRDDWLKDQLAAASPGQIVGGGRPDPTFNRLARHIQKAATQFDAVNQDRIVPNILIFVNHDGDSHFGDLREVFTGVFHADSGKRYLTMPHIAEGLIGHSKRRIDLYAWIDAPMKRVQGYIFSEVIPEHVTTLCRLLGLDASRIVR